MTKRNDWISHKIRLLANRLRCSECNSDSSKAVFIIGENLKFKLPVKSDTNYTVVYRGNHFRKMVLNKFYILLSTESLVRVCTHCGNSRKTGISNGFS
jgi:hypothetical protein